MQKDDYPILFEGLHTTYFINHTSLKNRIKLVRAHNIEHHYYKGLFRNEQSIYRKTYFLIEALKLKRYEHKLIYADTILALSTSEKDYFAKYYGKDKTVYLPLFADLPKQAPTTKEIVPQVLYHGDLSTPENINAASFLMQNVVPLDQSISWIFAGLNPDPKLIRLASQYSNISLRANLRKDEMDTLIKESAVNILYTKQVSGVKLKLLNALTKGNHCLATKEMTEGSGLSRLCIEISHNPEEIIRTIQSSLIQKISPEEKGSRYSTLSAIYDNNKNAQILIRNIKE
ncbi:hypothetical protein LJB98_00020 [Bacteroidales bacterium OttesenSCG-928-M11]|nr:hypothetical protein [Bacteroidales bacterium OttesenSCG-928-M11]